MPTKIREASKLHLKNKTIRLNFLLTFSFLTAFKCSTKKEYFKKMHHGLTFKEMQILKRNVLMLI